MCASRKTASADILGKFRKTIFQFFFSDKIIAFIFFHRRKSGCICNKSIPETVNGKRYTLRKNSLSLVIKNIGSISAYCTLDVALAAVGDDNKQYVDKISLLSYPGEE